MRTAVIGQFYPESFALNVATGLHALGHSVGRVSMDVPRWVRALRFNEMWTRLRLLPNRKNGPLALVHRSLRRRVRALGPCDLIVVTYDYLSPDDVEWVRANTGARIVCWFPDHIGAWGRALFLNAGYDAVFLKDPYAVHHLTAFTALPVYYLPECFDPSVYAGFRASEIPERFRVDVTTAGNCYSFRVAALAGLVKYNAKIWGTPPPLWMRTGAISRLLRNEYVVNVTKAQAFRGAKIVVNSLNPAEIWGLNARAFEVSGCGAFQLISWRPGLEQLFVDGEELVSYVSMTDLEAKIDEFIARPLHRARIARAGLLRARKDHTYEQRLQMMIRTTFGEAAGYDVVVPHTVMPPAATTQRTGLTG